MNNSTKVVIPRQALAVIAVVLAWWLYAAIILSLIGVVLWVVWLASKILFPVWVIATWTTIEILITLLMNVECWMRADLDKKDWGALEMAACACSMGSALAGMVSLGPPIGGGFYSLWTLVFTVAILAIHFHYQTNGSLKESK